MRSPAVGATRSTQSLRLLDWRRCRGGCRRQSTTLLSKNICQGTECSLKEGSCHRFHLRQDMTNAPRMAAGEFSAAKMGTDQGELTRLDTCLGEGILTAAGLCSHSDSHEQSTS